MTDLPSIAVKTDAEHGLSYIYLAGPIPPGGVKKSIRAGDDIVIDLDAAGAVIGIELLRGHLLHPSLAAIAGPYADANGRPSADH